MADFPFPADTIRNHRFHGVIEGTFVMDGDHVQLKTTFGTVGLLPRNGKGGANAFYAAKKNAANHPDAVIRAYGYPRTTPAGLVHRMELCSWHVVGTPLPAGNQSINGPPLRTWAAVLVWPCSRPERRSGDGEGEVRREWS